jgi:hypothetical protein
VSLRRSRSAAAARRTSAHGPDGPAPRDAQAFIAALDGIDLACLCRGRVMRTRVRLWRTCGTRSTPGRKGDAEPVRGERAGR